MLNIHLLWKWWIVTLVYLVMLTLLALSVSHGAHDYGKTEKELMKEEALNICRPCKWSGFFRACFIFSLFVFCYYKSYDTMLKYKIMFNQLIKPGKFPSFNSEAIHLLFCNNSIVPPTIMYHLFFVQKKKK